MKRLIATLAFLCMASSLPSLQYRALDNDGDPISGAKLYFYEDGTTTPLATYSDEALSSANANPVVADSNGWFGEIYLKTDEAYKIVMKSSDDATTYFTVDDINAAQLVSDAFQTRLKQAASNPLDYRSAVGDGVADEYLAVQDAIDNATGTVDLLGKTFRCDSNVTLTSGITLKNGTLDFSNSTGQLRIHGTIGSQVLLSANANGAATTISVASASGLSSLDWLLLDSDANYVNDPAAELVQIESVSGTTLTLTNPVQHQYTTANSAKIKKLTPANRVILDNVVLSHNNGGSNTEILSIQYATNVKVLNSRFTGASRSGIKIDDSAYVTIANTIFDDADDTDAAGITVNDDGDGTGASRNVLIDNCEFKTGEYGVEIHGTPARWVTIRNSSFNGADKGLFIGGGGADQIVVDGCEFVGDGGANAQITGPTAAQIFKNLRITNSSFYHGFNAVYFDKLYTPPSVGGIPDSVIELAGNWFYDGGVYLDDAATTGGNIEAIHIHNNYMEDNELEVVLGTASREIDRVSFIGNTLQDGEIIVTESGTAIINDLLIANNVIDSAATKPIDVNGPVTTTIHGNIVASGTTVEVTASRKTSIEKNSMVAAISVQPAMDAAGHVLISDNRATEITVDDPGTTTADLEHVTVSGNQTGDIEILAGADNEYTKVIVSGNIVENGSIVVTESGAAIIGDLLITGNAIDVSTDTKGVDITGMSRAVISGNNIDGQGSSTTHGVEITGVDYPSVTGNVIDGIITGGYGIYVEDPSRFSISSNILEVAADGIYLKATSGNSIGQGAITGNAVQSTSECVYLDDSGAGMSQITVSSNSLEGGGDDGIYVSSGSTGINYLVISGNTVEVQDGDSTIHLLGAGTIFTTISGNTLRAAADTADNIRLNGTGAADISNTIISGNSVQNGDYCIGEDTDANATAVVVIGNNLNGCNSGDIEFAVDLDVAADDHNL
jgi:hypothetical protein